MKRFALLSLGMALLSVSCTFPYRNGAPSPGIPVTGKTALPSTPTPVFLTATPQSTSVTPVHRSALFFDGQDDYIVVPDRPSLELQNSFTIAAWIYLESYTGWASIVTKGDKPNINNYAIQQSEPFDPLYQTTFGRMRFTGCARLPIPLPESQTILSLRIWHFVAVTFDGLYMHFYTDGKPDGISSVPGPLCTNNKPLYIGVDFPLTTEYWHGAIDELRIWNAPLSDSQVADLMNTNQTPLTSALVGYWSFDEGSGAVARDLSPFHNDGQIVGDPIWISSPVPTH